MMEKIEHVSIKFGTGNSAFEADAGAKIARILRTVADQFESGVVHPAIYDANGNFVGEVQILYDDD